MAYYENSDIIILVSNKTGNVHIIVTMRYICVTIVAMEKQTVTYSECAPVALVTQHTMHMHCVIFISVSSPAVTYFYTLSHKWHNSRKNLLNTKCVFNFLYNFSLRHVSFSEELREILSQMHIPRMSSCKVPAIHVRF